MATTEILIDQQDSWTAWVVNEDGPEFDLGSISSLPEAVKLADEAHLAGKCGYARRWRYTNSFVALPIMGPQRFADAPPVEDSANGPD